MDYAVVENKNTEPAWEQAQVLRKQKRGSETFQPRTERRRAPQLGRTIKKVADAIAKLALFLGFVYATYYGYRFLTSSPQFAIKEISITGNHIASKEQLLEKAGQLAGSNIFALNLSQLSKKIGEHPWVRSVSVERRLPQSIRITIVERTPYARIQMDKLYVLDNFGVLLSLAGPEHSNLPTITGAPVKSVSLGENVVTESIIWGLQTMRYFNRLNEFKTDPVEVLRMVGNHRITLVTRNRGIEISMDLNMLDEGFKNFKIFTETFGEKARNVKYIDLSFKGKVIVKHTPAESNQLEPQKL